MIADTRLGLRSTVIHNVSHTRSNPHQVNCYEDLIMNLFLYFHLFTKSSKCVSLHLHAEGEYPVVTGVAT